MAAKWTFKDNSKDVDNGTIELKKDRSQVSTVDGPFTVGRSGTAQSTRIDVLNAQNVYRREHDGMVEAPIPKINGRLAKSK
ncbi:UNVERIFIED_CONTAM: hypothetical protein K2H54_074405 [Gekko kuhli]